MAQLIDLITHTDQKGKLTVIEKVIPFPIKRIFYIYGVDKSVRGGHRHKETIQAAICIKGSCRIRNHDGTSEQHYVMTDPSACLILYPEDWHVMDDFTEDAILMVLASTNYDPDDYIFTPYPVQND